MHQKILIIIHVVITVLLKPCDNLKCWLESDQIINGKELKIPRKEMECSWPAGFCGVFHFTGINLLIYKGRNVLSSSSFLTPWFKKTGVVVRIHLYSFPQINI